MAGRLLCRKALYFICDQFRPDIFSKHSGFRSVHISLYYDCFLNPVGRLVPAGLRNKGSMRGKEALKSRASYSVGLSDFLIVDVKVSLPHFEKDVKHILRGWDEISVESHEEAFLSEGVNDNCVVDLEVVHISPQENLWQLERLKLILIKIQLKVKLKVLRVLGDPLGL